MGTTAQIPKFADDGNAIVDSRLADPGTGAVTVAAPLDATVIRQAGLDLVDIIAAALSAYPTMSDVTTAITSALVSYLTTATASATYETQAHASATYETQTHASATYTTAAAVATAITTALAAYLTAATASATYETQSHASATYETQSHASATYQTASAVATAITSALTAYLTAATASATYETQSHASATYTTPAAVATTLTAYPLKANNLSDLASPATALTNLGGAAAPTFGTPSAAGTTQAGATLLTADRNYITNGNGSNGVRLPATGLDTCVVWNASVSQVNVYPQTGGTIGMGSTNAANSLLQNGGTMFVRVTSTMWRTVFMG